MTTIDAPPDWSRLEKRLNLPDPEAFLEREVAPILATLRNDAVGAARRSPRGLDLPVSLGFGGFVVSFFALIAFLPDDALWAAVRAIVFIPMFLFWMFGTVYLFRHRFLAEMLHRHERFSVRARALGRIAQALDLTYVASPGGAPAGLKLLMPYRWVPQELRDLVAALDDQGGLDAPLEIARKSGVLMSSTPPKSTKRSPEEQEALELAHLRLEDGFTGERNGVRFSAFEWHETGEDSSDVYHLVMVFTLPRRLYGLTQLRSRYVLWPRAKSDVPLQRVGLVAPVFEDRFRLRTTDQVEARTVFDPAVLEKVAGLAKDQTVRAAAFEPHLVIDIDGSDRFALVDLSTGHTSPEIMGAALGHIADMLDLADAVAQTFRLKSAA